MTMKQPSPKTLAGRAAFSMIEIVVALSVMAIGLLAILGLFPQGLNSAKNAADDSLCALVAQDTIAARRIDIQDVVSTIGAANIPSRWFTSTGKEIIIIIDPTPATGAMFRCQINASLVICGAVALLDILARSGALCDGLYRIGYGHACVGGGSHSRCWLARV